MTPPARPRLPARRPRRVAAVAAALTVALLAACSGGDGDASDSTDPARSGRGDRAAVRAADVEPFDIDVDDLAGTGTPLGGGLSVPEGAVLQGAAIPDLVGGGYRALLLVVGEPVGVFNALEAQASSLGMAGTGACLGTEVAVGCTGTYVDGADGETLAVSVTRQSTEAGVVSGASLLYRPPGSHDGPAPDDAFGGPTSPLPSVALPDPVPVPEDIDVGLAIRPPGSGMRAVERGSVLVGLPGPCACDGPGWSFVVRIEGIARDVLNGYLRQFADLGETPDLEDRRRDDVTVLGARVGEGDATAEVRAIVPDDDPAYAMVTVRPG